MSVIIIRSMLSFASPIIQATPKGERCGKNSVSPSFPPFSSTQATQERRYVTASSTFSRETFRFILSHLFSYEGLKKIFYVRDEIWYKSFCDRSVFFAANRIGFCGFFFPSEQLVDYEPCLFFLGLSSETRETRNKLPPSFLASLTTRSSLNQSEEKETVRSLSSLEIRQT